MFRKLKCQRCKNKFDVLYMWYGLALCNPCIVAILTEIRKSDPNVLVLKRIR